MLLMARRSLSWRRTWVAFLALVTLAWVDPVLASDVVPSGYAYEVAPENLGPYADATGTLLTNGTLPSCAWPASCDYTEYVGWNGTGPTITFDFPEDVTVEAIALTVADSDGSAGVRSPASLTVNLGDSQQILALPNLEGTGVRRILIPLDTTVTGRVFTLHLRRSDLPSSSWIMLAEVEFIEAAEATPDGTSEAAKEPTFFASSTAVIGPAAGTDVVKANNADAMADGTSWVGDVAPTTGDTAIFDATFDNTVGFGTGDPLSWLGMEVTGGTSTIDIRNGNLDNWVGLGAGGLIMSSASARTVYVNSLQQQADHAWSVATGNNLFVGYRALSRGHCNSLSVYLCRATPA